MSVARVNVNPAVIEWAVDYSRRGEDLHDRFGKNLADWLDGSKKPTPTQLREFAKQARVPAGYLYTSHVPSFGLSIDEPAMRTIGDSRPAKPSPDLISTVYACQRRQNWYVDYAEAHDLPALSFVGSLSLSDDPVTSAENMRNTLRWRYTDRNNVNARSYRRALSDRAEEIGILVMVNGVVGNDTSRPLNPEEFRGFSLVDPLAPLVFINARDSHSAQVFTLAHELAHVWLGRTGISAPDHRIPSNHPVESWCNSVAAELLVPLEELMQQLEGSDPVRNFDRLVSYFKVSPMVLLRRLLESQLVDHATFRRLYRTELRASRTKRTGHGGGNFYATALTRVGRRFASAVYNDAKYGGTLLADAYKLLGVSNMEQMETLAENMRVPAL